METFTKFFALCLISVIFQVFCLSTVHGSSTDEPEEPKRPTLVCPSWTGTWCRCSIESHWKQMDLFCDGHGVTQKVIKNFFLEIRQANNFADDQFLHVRRLAISGSSLGELDLSPLSFTTVGELYIYESHNLRRIFSSSSNPLIYVHTINFNNNQLTDSALAETLQLLHPECLKGFNAWSNMIVGSQEKDVEFIPGLWNFTRLSEIDFRNNSIKILAGGQFSGSPMLSKYNFDNNPLEKVGEGAFSIGDSWNRRIQMNNCTLTDEKLNLGFLNNKASNDSNIVVELHGNRLEFLEETKFRPFLMQHPENELTLDYDERQVQQLWELYGLTASKNPFKCDERMRWLKSGKAQFENRVRNVTCLNDPGKTIFETSLV